MAERILRAINEGILDIGGKKIECAVLEDGTRVLSRTGFLRAMGRRGKAKGGRVYDDEFKTPVFLTAKNLKAFISNELVENSRPIPFRPLKGSDALGYRADLLPQVCSVFLDAKEAGALVSTQVHIAEACKILLRGFATVGITALVDEATGFQDDRDRRALAKILEAFIEKELRQWVKTFPVDYYKEMYRLKGLQYPPRGNRMPRYIGTLTNDVVYRRLAPAVLDALREKNPAGEKGRRLHKHHQWLTEDIGQPKLLQHLGAVVALMKITGDGDWAGFLKILDRTYPRQISAPLFERDQNDGQAQ
jgi:hypothetical protein